MTRTEASLYWFTWVILLTILVGGAIYQGPADALEGLLEIQLHSARLVNDFSLIGGSGAAMMNASLVAIIGLLLLAANKISISGPSLAAVYTMLGFGLFGKTPVNILPVILGVYIAARASGRGFNQYILIALFGTALAPVVSTIAVELLPGTPLSWTLAVVGGALLGLLLPAVAMVTLRFHQGFSLYNIGLASGFLALFAAALFLGAGGQLAGTLIWNEEPGLALELLIPLLSLVLIGAGLLGGPAKRAREVLSIFRLGGRLPSDFMDMATPGATLINMGLLGTMCWLYVLLVGAPLNGPVLGGILTVVGFGAFGKHPVNCLPVMGGIVGATLFFGVDLVSPGAILAVLFGTTLAPMAGEFGIVVGLVAGFVHFLMVHQTGAWHGGMTLYNNGFAGGLTATLLAAFFEWRSQTMKKPEAEEKR
ncbi:MAG: DUF1576 domain-containing protein [Spirochaetaceae bacterium]